MKQIILKLLKIKYYILIFLNNFKLWKTIKKKRKLINGYSQKALLRKMKKLDWIMN